MRRGGKKGPANVPAQTVPAPIVKMAAESAPPSTVPLAAESAPPPAAPLAAESAPPPPAAPPREATRESRAPARRGCEGAPPATTDHPWRDLHPTRVWPD